MPEEYKSCLLIAGWRDKLLHTVLWREQVELRNEGEGGHFEPELPNLFGELGFHFLCPLHCVSS